MNCMTIWGFMGAGKSTIGRALAQRYAWKWIDSDTEIEKQAKLTIPDIFQRYGESYFRQLETQFLEDLWHQVQRNQPASELLVITTGGGMPIQEENRRWLKKLGISIYLHVPFDTIVDRLKRDSQRPLWDGTQLEAMKCKYEARLPYYRQADVIIETQGKSVEEIVQDIAAAIRHWRSS
ncbi:shikimate kinase [Caldalkalibacillus uzonensis]|uniref:Shikimate kinase n=1 Tax=Caldalkalibacillus uzonensis TaxID=353224 RepID=A0ABU0CMP0_9BACI|nr:shikimate kinase [Caldalkalibacillus uzonensis]MDQ0337679.1 shikimate kinase [Caldalkalibacillus uzonensis]